MYIIVAEKERGKDFQFALVHKDYGRKGSVEKIFGRGSKGS
jgi:hypothetical protein